MNKAKTNFQRSAGGKSPSEFSAPDLPYLPRAPRNRERGIGLIGCGGVTEHHLKAYKKDGLRVLALADPDKRRAEERRDMFYPNARVFADVRALLDMDAIEVVDIATHPDIRPSLIRQSLEAGKHVLSQKPFVLDLDVGEELVTLAKRHKRKLAVNHNARWAPYFSYMLSAVRGGLIGEIASLSMHLRWDHSWTAKTAFNEIHHLILYDFAIHWFDMARLLFGGKRALRVFAQATRAPRQKPKPPMIANALIEFEKGAASIGFNGASPYADIEEIALVGTESTLSSRALCCKSVRVRIDTPQGHATAKLKGQWFPDGFRGTMCELLCAIEENREPSNSAASALESLAISFAALRSASTGLPSKPGEVGKVDK
jgi:predicted dehydrogenase